MPSLDLKLSAGDRELLRRIVALTLAERHTNIVSSKVVVEIAREFENYLAGRQ